jgi:hypothetical protein
MYPRAKTIKKIVEANLENIARKGTDEMWMGKMSKMPVYCLQKPEK